MRARLALGRLLLVASVGGCGNATWNAETGVDGSAGTPAGTGGRGGTTGGTFGAGGYPGRAGTAGPGAGGAERGGAFGNGGTGGIAGSAGGAGGRGVGGTSAGPGGRGTAGSDGGVTDGSADSVGQANVSYLGCTYLGGIDRIVVAKRDLDRDLCLNVVLSSPGTAPSGLSLPSGLGLESATAAPAASCPSRNSFGTRASQVSGVVDTAAGGGPAGYPSRVNVAITVTFPAIDGGAPPTETLSTQNLDVQSPCP